MPDIINDQTQPDIDQHIKNFTAALAKDNGWDKFRKPLARNLSGQHGAGAQILGALLNIGRSPSEVAAEPLEADETRLNLGKQYGQIADTAAITQNRQDEHAGFQQGQQMLPWQRGADIFKNYGRPGLDAAAASGMELPTMKFDPATKRFVQPPAAANPNQPGDSLTGAILEPLKQPTTYDTEIAREKSRQEWEGKRDDTNYQRTKLQQDAQTQREITKESAATKETRLKGATEFLGKLYEIQSKSPDNPAINDLIGKLEKEAGLPSGGNASAAQPTGQVDGSATLSEEQAAAYLAARRGGMSKEEAYKKVTGQ